MALMASGRVSSLTALWVTQNIVMPAILLHCPLELCYWISLTSLGKCVPQVQVCLLKVIPIHPSACMYLKERRFPHVKAQQALPWCVIMQIHPLLWVYRISSPSPPSWRTIYSFHFYQCLPLDLEGALLKSNSTIIYQLASKARGKATL